MSIFTTVIRCGVCGEPLEGQGPYTCRVCGNVTQRSNPGLEEELGTANAMRECTRFDEAQALYKQIVKKYKNDDLSEVYWNQLLCEQHVMFETDEKGERFPSFYAVVADDVEDSPYYTCAMAAAERHAPERVPIFAEMAEKMLRVKQLYSRIRESAKPYDVFICFKKSKLDGSGNTPDTDLAIDLYNHFAKDYHIFFSERSLRDVAVRDFEPNIYYALYTAKVMLLLCSKREYVDSQWVKNEWSRYCAFAQNPAVGKTVIPIFLEDFSPASLPTELLSYQGLADNRHLFDDLDRTLRKILKPVDVEAELNARLSEQSNMWQKMMEEQRRREEELRRQNEEQQRKMQEQLDAAIGRSSKGFTKQFTPSAADLGFKIKNGVLVDYLGKGGDVVIPSNVTSIGEMAFQHDYEGGLSIKIPSSVKTIGLAAFGYCTDLKSVSFSPGVTSIGNEAFAECVGLTSLALPLSLKEIANWAFVGCVNLETITVERGNTTYHSEGNCLIETASKTLILGCKNSVIPTDGSVIAIGEGAFAYCSGLASITLPPSLVSIGEGAFRECTSLTSVEIPVSVADIGKDAFGGCKNLEKIILPFIGENVEGKGKTSLKYIFGEGIPTSLRELEITGDRVAGKNIFSDFNNLEVVTCSSCLEKQIKKQFGFFERKKIKFVIKD